jgi:hypothetical protein
MRNKKILSSTLIVLLLSSCTATNNKNQDPISQTGQISNTESNIGSSITLNVPSHCDKTYIYQKLKEKNPSAIYKKQILDPIPGSDLETLYNAGGISCSYLIGSQEIIVSLAPFYEELFAPLLLNWIESGMSESILPGLEAKNYILTTGKRETKELITRKIISHTKDHWLSIDFGNKPTKTTTELIEIVKMAYQSFISEKLSLSNSLNNSCYKSTSPQTNSNDLEYININYHQNTTITAELTLKDNSSDKILLIGNYENDIIHGYFTYTLAGEIVEQELILYGGNLGLKASSTPTLVKNNLNEILYPRPLKIGYNTNYDFLPTDCKS